MSNKLNELNLNRNDKFLSKENQYEMKYPAYTMLHL